MDTQALRDEVIKTYHLETLSPEKQTEMIDQIGSLIFQGVMLKVVPTLSEKAQGELEKILGEDGDPQQLMDFLAKEAPDLDAIFKEETETFKKESATIMNQMGK